MKHFIYSIFFALITSTAHAETFRLMSSNSWEVEYVQPASGSAPWCAAYTVNNSNEKFDLTYHSSDKLILYIFFPYEDDSSKRTVDFEIHFDDEEWAMNNGSLDGNMLHINLGSDLSQLDVFFKDMSKSDYAYLIGTNGKILSRWSLSGSSKALRGFADCVGKL